MLRDEVAKIVAKAARNVTGKSVHPEIIYPDPKFGDFATNLPLILAKKMGKKPAQVASDLVEKIKHPAIVSLEVAGPGFINIRFSESFWIENLKALNRSLASDIKENSQNIQVEYISANPTGPLTLGNARGAFRGDVIARLLIARGHKVTKEYYFNDGGKQISDLIKSIAALEAGKKSASSSYRGEYLKDLIPIYKKYKSASAAELSNQITEYVWQSMLLPTIKKLKIEFDQKTNEQELDTSVKNIEKILSKQGLISKKDNTYWLASTKLGDTRDRVLFRDNGEPTYLANDIVYHYDIFSNRDFDRAIKVWGADHSGQVASLKLTINKILPDKILDFYLHQWVRLIKNGREQKISKRTGSYITVEEVLADIKPDVMRWFFLERSAGTRIDFNLNLAKEESQKNPYYYSMYAYVRARSILSKANSSKLKATFNDSALTPVELILIRQLCKLPELIIDVSQTFELQQLVNYAHGLAGLFHEYYESETIIKLPAKIASQKLAIVERFAEAMEFFFDLLGITPVKKM